MKKFLKIAGFLAGGVAILVIALIVVASMVPMVPDDYTQTVETGGELEAAYMATGPYDVDYHEEKTDGDLEKYEVYYPSKLKKGKVTWPMVLIANGTGVSAERCEALFRHLASWGFIVVGNEHPSTGFGLSSEATLIHMLDMNKESERFLYQKIDTLRIGITGHSQGGAGVLTAMTRTEHRHMYRTGVALSPTNEEMSHKLGWKYRLEDVQAPLLMLAGTAGDFETKMVIPVEAMRSMYDKLTCPKVMARKSGEDHGRMLYAADGYVTAWLCWQLQDDRRAAGAFMGDKAELLHNKRYQDQQIDWHQAE